MLINNAISHIESKLDSIGIFERVYDFVELLQMNGDTKTRPYHYCSEGVYKPISVTEFNGIAYIRKNGKNSVSDARSATNIPCESPIRVSIPLKIVAFKQRSQMPNDSAFSDDDLAESVISAVIGKSAQLKLSVGAFLAEVTTSGWDTDSRRVWNEETNEQRDVNTTIACCSVDVNVSFIIDMKCLKTLCGYGKG